MIHSLVIQYGNSIGNSMHADLGVYWTCEVIRGTHIIFFRYGAGFNDEYRAPLCVWVGSSKQTPIKSSAIYIYIYVQLVFYLLTLVFCNINYICCTNAQNFFLSVTPTCIIFVNLSYGLLANIFDV